MCSQEQQLRQLLTQASHMDVVLLSRECDMKWTYLVDSPVVMGRPAGDTEGPDPSPAVQDTEDSLQAEILHS